MKGCHHSKLHGVGGKVKKAIARESEAIGTIAAAYSSISQAYTMLRFLYHQAVTNLVEQGGWEGTDEDGKGDAFLMRFGTLFENYCGRSALFGVFKIFQKLLFSILIGTVGNVGVGVGVGIGIGIRIRVKLRNTVSLRV